MHGHRRPRGAFTLTETLVALAIGSAVLGGALGLYVTGQRHFRVVTEHASFREEAILCLERIAKDMQQLIVSTEMKPNGKFHLVEPYELGRTYSQTVLDPVTRKPVHYTTAGKVMRCWVYHHTEMVDGKPVIVGQMVEYETKPVNAARLEQGVDLFRNGERVNHLPLSEIIFQHEPPIVAAEEIGGSPNGILTVTVVPKGGMWGQMTRDVLERLRADRSLVTRTFHLVGYESLYTTVLYAALQTKAREEDPEGLHAAVLDDAVLKSPALLEKIEKGRDERGAAAYVLPEGTVRIEWTKSFQTQGAGQDATFLAAPLSKGILQPSDTAADASDLAGSHAGSHSDEGAGL